MPRLEELGYLLRGAGAVFALDMIQGYWQMPLHENAQEMFIMVTAGGLFTPTRVPQGVLNATAYFQAIMSEVLKGWWSVCVWCGWTTWSSGGAMQLNWWRGLRRFYHV